MNKLDLIWALENHNNELEELQTSLKTLKKATELNSLKENLENLEARLISIREEYEGTKKRIRTSELVLRDYDFTIRGMDKELYSGEIADIKELEHLSREKNTLVDQWEELETELLELMEVEEKLDKEIGRLEWSFTDIEGELISLEKRSEEEERSLIKAIEEKNNKILDSSNLIPQKDLDIYTGIRGTKLRAIVAVENNICTGCNMRIPTYMSKEIRDKLDFQRCDNCGRILYYIE